MPNLFYALNEGFTPSDERVGNGKRGGRGKEKGRGKTEVSIENEK